ncbi:E3 ubiquitin-protein ligase DTX1-like [Schistocerca nitens]|uniref:E3 ubiquitin-protein ligase DTX1-like n=1 Tax=Schistocerca nitens TaxID=7011 RepID=UPI0021195083|nr:E3 ubiquitin-protein ligase DTX1-like [Schistocerca nitens]
MRTPGARAVMERQPSAPAIGDRVRGVPRRQPSLLAVGDPARGVPRRQPSPPAVGDPARGVPSRKKGYKWPLTLPGNTAAPAPAPAPAPATPPAAPPRSGLGLPGSRRASSQRSRERTASRRAEPYLRPDSQQLAVDGKNGIMPLPLSLRAAEPASGGSLNWLHLPGRGQRLKRSCAHRLLT